jgi:hypothetical protein
MSLSVVNAIRLVIPTTELLSESALWCRQAEPLDEKSVTSDSETNIDRYELGQQQ